MKLLTKHPVKPGNTRLSHGTRTASELRTLRSQHWMKQREKLLRLREELSERIRQLANEACEETPSYSLHMADAATDSFDRDLTLGLVSFEQEALYEIDAALKRIEDGTYGICELTGQQIPWNRLEAIPWARFSVGAEKTLDGRIHPHIGALGSVRPDL
jgi:RNA polymerase-binding protein DksA